MPSAYKGTKIKQSPGVKSPGSRGNGKLTPLRLGDPMRSRPRKAGGIGGPGAPRPLHAPGPSPRRGYRGRPRRVSI